MSEKREVRDKMNLRNYVKTHILYSHKEGSSEVRFGFKKLKFAHLGKRLRFDKASTFIDPQNITIGDDVFFARESYFDAKSKITIGNGCMFGPRVFCVAGSHNYDSSDLRSVPYDNRLIDLPVVIEDNVWIAGNVSIAPGTVIGEGSVVGMGAVVAGNIPPYSVVVGGKGRVLKNRNCETYKKLKTEGLIYGNVFAGKGFELMGRSN